MFTVKISHSHGIGMPTFGGTGRGRTLESAALNAYRDSGFRGREARLVPAGDNRYAVRFRFPAYRGGPLVSSAVWDLRVL